MYIRLFIRQHNFFAVVVFAIRIIVTICFFRLFEQTFITRFSVHPQHNLYMQKLAQSRIVVIALYIKILQSGDDSLIMRIFIFRNQRAKKNDLRPTMPTTRISQNFRSYKSVIRYMRQRIIKTLVGIRAQVLSVDKSAARVHTVKSVCRLLENFPRRCFAFANFTFPKRYGIRIACVLQFARQAVRLRNQKFF